MDTNLDVKLKIVLNQIYKAIEENAGEVTVSSPEYKQTQIDELINKGFIEKIDASTLSGWIYILKPTYKGEKVISDSNKLLRSKVEELIRRGIDIGIKESHSANAYNNASVGGPLFDAWMGEINIFNERHLKGHPLHDSIHATYFHRNNRPSSYADMMGHLRALSLDEEFLGHSNKVDKEIATMNNDLISQMLSDDIKRCQAFLDNPEDEEAGIEIYVDITSRYDSVIPDFGRGLYQYIEEQHFYDPEISGDTLIFNLKKLLNKMMTYLALNYPSFTKNDSINESLRYCAKENCNRVFIVHGHDNEAKQEVARTLEKAGFEAVILHEQADGGLTIIEKIEKYTDVAFAVVLYTECDLGRSKGSDSSSERYRARQNVVFEHGYLIGRLGRKNVSAIVKGNVETPGDISGVVYTPMDENGAWKMQLGKNMKDAGLDIDFNKLCY